MTRHAHEEGEKPRPELLAGYVDGELDEVSRARVNDLLTRDSDAVADVESQRAIDRLWEQSAAPLPSDDQWAMLLTRIHQATPNEKQSTTQGGRWRRWSALTMLGLTAASVLVTLSIWRGVSPPSVVFPNPPPQQDEEPLQIANADDVEIISIQGTDHEVLIVGVPPVHEPLVLATAEEVRMNRVEPAADGRMPVMPVTDELSGPMIIMPKRP